MKNVTLILFLLLTIWGAGVYGQSITISGTVKDAANGEDLIGVNIYAEGHEQYGTVSNEYGFYSLSMEAGDYTIVYSFVGMETLKKEIGLVRNITMDMELVLQSDLLEEVTVSAEKGNRNITSAEMSVSRVQLREIEKIPVLLGEKDLIKTIQLLPGVKSGGEGSTGFFVRGGAADQNLILLDGAPVYNASHLLGFFSVFNSDAIKDVKLYKGYAPAKYGGRLSSVMDIKMKEGNLKKLSMSGGIGLISSRLTLEAPIVKDKGSFIISGRRTYLDLFLPLSRKEEVKDSKLYFYDLNLKANYKPGKKDRIFLSGYFGRDDFGFSDEFGFDWGNKTASLRWNHIFNEKVFSNTTLIYSDYNYRISESVQGIDITSAISDINIKQDFDYFLNPQNKLSAGANVVYHKIDPGSIVSSSEGISSMELEKRNSLEAAIYVENEQKIASRLKLSYGLRYHRFYQLGPGKVYSYYPNGNIADTSYYKKWEKVVSYSGLSPRFSASFTINSSSSVKASYSRNFQNLHLLSTSTSGTPLDIWMPSSNNIKPGIGDQAALGYFRNFDSDNYEFSVESYYKKLQNVVDYRDGADVMLRDDAEGQLLYGKGRAYGIELFLKKRTGSFTGWVSYTLSRSEKQIEGINGGSWYYAKQDRLHDISLVMMLQLNERINISGSWVYYTGNAVSFPSGKYLFNGKIRNLYTSRNGYRMPAYHRLDLGLTIEGKKKRYDSSWNFSVYNLYARENAWIIQFRPVEDDPINTEAVQISLFKIVPSITYNFKF